MSFASAEECKKWLEVCHANASVRSKKDFEFKLNKIKGLVGKLKVILVAGTNGKGSTCLLLEALLLASKQTVGTFVSPHLIYITERIRVNGVDIAEPLFCRAFEYVYDLYETDDIVWFEFLTLVAFWLFRQQPLDYIVLELGIGGRYDILNTLSPDISVITSIGLDHQELLGTTLEQIGWQKAGIFRHDKPAICGDAEPPASVSEYGKEIGANLLIQNDNFRFESSAESWQWQLGEQHFLDLPIPAMPLSNASTVLAVLNQCPDVELSREQLCDVLSKIQIPGRLQIVRQAPQILLDVAHNPQACANLLAYLKEHPVNGQEFAVLGIKANKDIEACLAIFNHFFRMLYIVLLNEADATRNRYHNYFDKQASEQTVSYSTSALEAFKKAESIASKNDRITVFGSFQTVGPILQETVQRES
jgi:dihydrofolate synthase/folylpolyglutamate synthase